MCVCCCFFTRSLLLWALQPSLVSQLVIYSQYIAIFPSGPFEIMVRHSWNSIIVTGLKVYYNCNKFLVGPKILIRGKVIWFSVRLHTLFSARIPHMKPRNFSVLQWVVHDEYHYRCVGEKLVIHNLCLGPGSKTWFSCNPMRNGFFLLLYYYF